LQRTFIAFDPGDQVKTKLSRFIDEGKKAYPVIKNWIGNDNIHFTYRFIGDTDEAHIPLIISKLSEMGKVLRPFALNKVKLSWYPFNNSPLICLMYQYHNPFMVKQYYLLGEYLEQLGYQLDKRHLNFHITLARLKDLIIQNPINWNESLIQSVEEIQIKKMIYYKSTLYRTGAVYEVLKEINLEGGIDVS